MYYSYNLIKQFIIVNDKIENIAKHLTLKTCEIEEITQRVIPESVVIGKVLETKKHPNADKLTICQVDCWIHGKYQICTAAENIAHNFYVPIALPGTYLPNIQLEIQKREMRGEVSNGMICAKEELGIQEDLDIHGIRNMQAIQKWQNKNNDFTDISDQDIGKSLTEKYPRLNNTIIDVDNKTITNRPDLTGHFGLAQEIYAIYQTHDQKAITNDSWLKKYKTDLATPIKEEGTLVVKSDKVRSYTTLSIPWIIIQPSSLQTRIHMIDLWLQPRNNRVDFSNYFMLTTGQPIHCFDKAKVQGDINVREANDWEEFVDLFDKTHILQEGDLIICDQDKILALAGIIGGKNSGITDKTQDIIIEIANFDPIITRKTAIRLWLRTDAIMRFEKNINPLYTKQCTSILLAMIKTNNDQLWVNLNNITIQRHNNPQRNEEGPTNISYNTNTITQRIFWERKEYFDKIITHILTNLGCTINQWKASIPSWRWPEDLRLSEDLEEEVARVYGYEKIDTQNINKPTKASPYNPLEVVQSNLEIIIEKHHGDLVEIYPWTTDKNLNIFEVDKKRLLRKINALAPDLSYLSDSTLYNLITLIQKNAKFFDELKLATITDVQAKTNSTEPFNAIYGNIHITTNSIESKQLGMIYYKKKCNQRYDDTFLHCKKIGIDSIQAISGELWSRGISLKPTDSKFFHPNKQAIIEHNTMAIGFVWQLHPLIVEQYKIDTQSQVSYISLDLAVLTHSIWTNKNHTYNTLQDQIVVRDLSFVVEKTINFSPLIQNIQDIKQISNVNIFDIYQGKQLPNDKKAIALQITIQGDGNMTTDQINAIMEQAIKKGEKTGAILRKNFQT